MRWRSHGPNILPTCYSFRSGRLAQIAARVALATFILLILLSLGVGASSAQSWIQLTPGVPTPAPRYGVTSVYNPASNRMIVFGGYVLNAPNGQTHQNDVWILTGANGNGTPSWTQAIPNGASGSPPGRQGGTAVYDQNTNRMIIFGGTDPSGATFNDVWVLLNADGTSGTPTWQQMSPSGTIPQRALHEAVYDPVNNRMIVFGGQTPGVCPCTHLNDVWVLTNANGAEATPPTWNQVNSLSQSPVPRSDFGMAYDVASNRMIVFGGLASNAQVLADVWVLTSANGLGGSPAWQQLNPAGVQLIRFGLNGAYDSVANRLIVFGGLAQDVSNSTSLNDTWFLTNANGLGGTVQWQQLPVSGALPPGRETAGSVYDAVTNRLVVFGGLQNGQALSDTWVLTNANGVTGNQLQISSVRPNQGGNAGTATVNIVGASFQAGAQVRLSGAGSPDIPGANTNVVDTGLLTTTFDLQGATPGARDLSVVNPDGSSISLASAFTIVQGGIPEISSQIVGGDKIRFDSPRTWYLEVTNTGPVDSPPGLVSLTVPSVVGFQQMSGSDLFVAGSTTHPDFMIPAPGPTDDSVLLFATDGVPASGSQFAQVQLTLPSATAVSSFTLRAGWQQDLANLSLDDFLGLENIPFIPYPSAGCLACVNAYDDELLAYSDVSSAYRAFQAARTDEINVTAQAVEDLFLTGTAATAVLAGGLTTLQGVAVGTLAGLISVCVEHVIDDQSCLPNLADLLMVVEVGVRDCLAGAPSCLQQLGLPPSSSLPTGLSKALTTLFTFADLSLSAIKGLVAQNNVFGAEQAALGTLQQALGPYRLARAAYNTCLSTTMCPVPPLPPTPNPPVTTMPVGVVSSLDPNDKEGSQGAGGLRYVSGLASLPYAIYFANEATATASAQRVVITDQLDLLHDDLSTFSLGPITFGNQLVPATLPGQTSVSTSVDLRPANNVLVSVIASLNTSSGLLSWNFQSLDPSTGLPPTDPTVGFLPPGTGGGTFFTVMPKLRQPTNTQIQNQATIVFDANPPISTPTWTNTLDNTAPVSHVVGLPSIENSLNFPVQWAGTDVGAGVQDFSVYASDNGGPFTAFQANTTSTSATFTGQVGHTYGFYSIARDLVGNVESAKTNAEATTQVILDTTPPVTVASVSPGPNANGWNNTNVTVTLNSSDNEPNGTGVKDIIYGATGAQNIAATIVNGASTSFTISTEGVTTITFFGTDNAGNVEVMRTIAIRLDKTPPTVTCSPNPNVLWPPNNKLVPVNVSVNVTDSLSGPAGFSLVSVTSNEPDSGLGEIQGFVVGTPSTSGQLQAQRLGSGSGRTYSFTYSGADKAGNLASCTTTVSVPHDQGK